jgi:hypothetical protein
VDAAVSAVPMRSTNARRNEWNVKSKKDPCVRVNEKWKDNAETMTFVENTG